jgi:hypothetical protein
MELARFITKKTLFKSMRGRTKLNLAKSSAFLRFVPVCIMTFTLLIKSSRIILTCGFQRRYGRAFLQTRKQPMMWMLRAWGVPSPWDASLLQERLVLKAGETGVWTGALWL